MAKKATVRLRVYEYIKTYKQERDGNSPTYQEIADHFGWGSSTTAYWHVTCLARHGYVGFDSRGRIQLGGEYSPPDDPPFRGFARAY